MRLDSVEAINDRVVGGGAVDRRARITDLYRTHSPAAFRVAYLITGDRVVAEDLTQEAFAKVMVRFRDIRDPGAFGAYLRTAVVNLAHSHFRRLRVERDYVRKQARDTPQVAPPPTEPRDDLRRALMTLPVRQRTAIVLRYYEDLTEYQAAEAMGVSANAVKALVARGMETLRRAVADEHIDSPTGGRP